MSIIRQNLKQHIDRARIARYNRLVAIEGLRQSRAVAHIERANSGAPSFI